MQNLKSDVVTATCFGLWVRFLSFSSLFLSDYDTDRTTLDETLEDSDRGRFGFQLIDFPIEESGPTADKVAIESSIVCESDTEVGYFVAAGDREDTYASDFDKCCYFTDPDPAVMRLQAESAEPPREDGGQMLQFWENIGKEQVMDLYDPLSTFEDVCLSSDVATVPRDICKLPTQFSCETSEDVGADTSVTAHAASDDIPSSAVSDTLLLHTAVDARELSLQLMVGEITVLPAAEAITCSSALVTSSSMCLAAVEACQSSDQLLSLSVCEPVYAHPDVVYPGSSPDAEPPMVLEHEQTHSDEQEERRIPFGPQFPSESAVEEIRQPDGTVVRRRVIRTRVRRVATRRVRRRQPDGRVVEYTETVELPEEEGDDRSDTQLEGLVGAGTVGQVVGVHTDSEQPGEPRVDTDVEVIREMLPDGRVVERQIVRTRQRRTVVKRVVVRPERP